jgi:hypothetical protein
VEVRTMGRKPLETTVIVERQMDAWVEVDRAGEDLERAYKRLQAAKAALCKANGLLERMPEKE